MYVPSYIKNDIDRVIEYVGLNFDNSGINNLNVNVIKKDLFFAMFIKNSEGKYFPIIYDKRFFDNLENDIPVIKKRFKYLIEFYEKKFLDKTFLIWVNKYNYHYYLKFVVIPVLIILIIYFTILSILVMLYNSNKEDNISNNEEIDEELLTEIIDYNKSKNKKNNELYEDFEENSLNENQENQNSSLNNENTQKINVNYSNDVYVYYKNLWSKNFEISENFKNEFPFEKILREIRLSYSPEDYMKSCLNISKEYFKWELPKIFIAQKNGYVDIYDFRNILKEEDIYPTYDVKKKGTIFIPLYPYNKSKIFGYFSFFWNHSEDFVLSDILYLLKFIFSENAKYLFINHKNHISIRDRINKLVEANDDVTIGVIEVDYKEKYNFELSSDERNILDLKIQDDINNILNKATIFEFIPFVYAFAFTGPFEQIKDNIEEFFTNKNNYNYYISPSRGNIAVTFSIGISSKRKRNIRGIQLLREAEDFLNISIQNGGDQYSGQ